jgi:hypothetical protein
MEVPQAQELFFQVRLELGLWCQWPSEIWATRKFKFSFGPFIIRWATRKFKFSFGPFQVIDLTTLLMCLNSFFFFYFCLSLILLSMQEVHLLQLQARCGWLA